MEPELAMEGVEQYLTNVTRMWQFVGDFAERAAHVFKVKRVQIEENHEVGGPLVCYFFMHSYEVMPPAEVVQALAEPLRDFSFAVNCGAVEDPGTEFDEFLCYFYLTVDWGSDVYSFRQSDAF